MAKDRAGVTAVLRERGMAVSVVSKRRREWEAGAAALAEEIACLRVEPGEREQWEDVVATRSAPGGRARRCCARTVGGGTCGPKGTLRQLGRWKGEDREPESGASEGHESVGCEARRRAPDTSADRSNRGVPRWEATSRDGDKRARGLGVAIWRAPSSRASPARPSRRMPTRKWEG